MPNTPDWGAIETAYCAGVLSLREIAELYGNGITEGAIRKRAAKLGWVRNKKNGTQKSTQVRKSGTQKNSARTTQSPVKSGDGEKCAEGKDEHLQKTKPIRGSRTDPPIKPFQPGNQHALKHGGYARRLLLSDEVIEDAKALQLEDELFRLRASNLVAAENIGRWMTKLEDVTEPQEKKSLLENISAAEKAMMRNTVRIESITGTLATVGKIFADTDYRLITTEKVGLEVDRLRREVGDPNDNAPRGLNDFYADIETNTESGTASVLDDEGEE
ncbi:hypothetical protein H4F39_07315 [Pectobacterium brasiliense]|uniref:hypothetical protein n=1 Tax=Pectobacterium brasiliense TaxID=180957 RepID=UPI001969AE16|nr:hypothetical protein [Pectobacterium brasiliense]MBN3093497.1 hypothetical protein [Pectobacterium brasiliense]